MNLLQDYFNRATALNRQRGMTGNMQYGKALDSSLAEGYFGAYEKNKQQSMALANQQKALSLQQKGLQQQGFYNMANLSQRNKEMNQSNLLGWGATGAQLLSTGATMLYDNYQKNQQQNAIDARTRAMLAGQQQNLYQYSFLPEDTGDGNMTLDPRYWDNVFNFTEEPIPNMTMIGE